MHIPPFLIAGLLALVLTYAIAYEMRWVAQGLGAMAPPGGRHIHTHPVPRLGGLAIFGGALLALLVTLPIDQPVALVRETRYVVLAVPYKPPPLPVVGILLGAAAAGSALGFLRHNFNPAQSFMGDSGSMLLGFLLGAAAVQGLAKAATALSLAVPVLALALPILDTGYAIVRRYRNGVSIFVPDRGHLHHRLLDRGLSQRQVVFTLWLLSAILGLGGLAAAGINRMLSLVLLTLIAVFLVVLGWRLGLVHLHRPHAAELPGPANLP